MTIRTTDTSILLEDGTLQHPLMQKPELPDYGNVTPRPYFACCYIDGETIWERLCFCMETLPKLCPGDPYLGCYALILRHLYPLLLSDNQAKNLAAYGAGTDCMAYRAIQDFMTFLHKGNALTALAWSPFSMTAVSPGSCAALLYRLDTCPAPAAVCDAVNRVKPGGLLLLYTIKETLPDELVSLCAQAQKDSFCSCTLYTLTVDEALMDFARANGTEAFLLARSAEITKRANDLRNLLNVIPDTAPCPEDTYLFAALLLQQTEEILLSIYDYLEDEELPIRANALKEAVLNHYTGSRDGLGLSIFTEKLTEMSENFFAAVASEFPL